MKSIGSVFKEARARKGYSRQKVSEITKIKVSFVEAIEKGNWDTLPSLSTVTGFVGSIAKSLSIDEKMAVAILKRDYLPKKIQVNPRQPQRRRLIWGPKLTFILGVVVFCILILTYLGFQYNRFVSPPILQIDIPKEGQIVKTGTLVVAGRTDADATVKVNSQPALVGDDGIFSTQIDIAKDVKMVVIVATARSGRTTAVSRTIQVE